MLDNLSLTKRQEVKQNHLLIGLGDGSRVTVWIFFTVGNIL